jgi:SSS family solute:Na+ symporter
VLGLVIALLIDDIIAIYELALTFTASTLVMPVLAAMFWRRATTTGVIVSMVAAAAAAVLWRLAGTPFGLHEIAPGLLVSAITLVIVSLVSRHSANETVTAYALEGRGTPTGESTDAHESRTLSNES